MRDKRAKRSVGDIREEEARIVDVTIESSEKRKEPRKHYVFCVTVAWADGTVNIIYRRYSHFFNLHTCLQNEFRAEAGSKRPSERILPFFPGRMMFGRTQKAAMKRLQPLDEYCKSLIHLPSYISCSPCVLQFFQPTEDDIVRSLKNPRKASGSDRKMSSASVISLPIPVETYIAIAAFEGDGKDLLSLEENVQVDVIDRNESGWWLVSTDEGQGWVPSSYLEKLDGDPDEADVIRYKDGQEEKYIVTTEYLPTFDDEMTLTKGAVVEVMEKTMDGWWLVRQGGAEGRAPSTNLKRADTVKAKQALDKSVPSTGQPSRLRKLSQDLIARDEPSGFSSCHDYQIPPSLQTALPPRRRSVKAGHHRNVSRQTSIGVTHVAVSDFISTGAAMSLREGDTMVMLEQMNNNWCLVELSGGEEEGLHTGWVPSTYLKPLVDPQASPDADSAPKAADGEYEYQYGLPPHGYYNVPGSNESSSRFSDVASSVGANSMASSGLDSPTAMSTTDSDTSNPYFMNQPGTGTGNAYDDQKDRNPPINATGWDSYRDSLSGSEYSSENSKSESSSKQNAESESSSIKTAESESTSIDNTDEHPSITSVQRESSDMSDNTEDKSPGGDTFISPVWGPADVADVEDTTAYPIYMARSNFIGKGTNETNLEQGEMVKVLEKSGQGWWVVRGKAGQGVVPSHFLRIPPTTDPAPTQPTFSTATMLAPYKPKNIQSNNTMKPLQTGIKTNEPTGEDGNSPKSVNELLRMFNKV